MKYIVSFLAVLVLGSLIYFGPDLYRFFGVRYEDARRDVFEQNISYTRGTIEHLERLKLQFELADTDGHREAIRQTALTTVASFNTTNLPPHLNNWIEGIR